MGPRREEAPEGNLPCSQCKMERLSCWARCKGVNPGVHGQTPGVGLCSQRPCSSLVPAQRRPLALPLPSLSSIGTRSTAARQSTASDTSPILTFSFLVVFLSSNLEDECWDFLILKVTHNHNCPAFFPLFYQEQVSPPGIKMSSLRLKEEASSLEQ